MLVSISTGTCKTCGKSFQRQPRGRPRVFGSEPCTQRAWAAAHPDAIHARRVRNYKKFGDRIRTKALKWDRDNSEAAKVRKKLWRMTDNGKLLDKAIFHR